MPENKTQPNIDLKEYIVEVVSAIFAARNEINASNDRNINNSSEKIILPGTIDFDISLSVIQSDGNSGKLAVSTGLLNLSGNVGSDDSFNSSGRVKFTLFVKKNNH